MNIKFELRKKRNIFLLGTFIIVAMIGMLFNLSKDTNEVTASRYEKVKYDGDQEIEAALKKLNDSSKRAHVIKDIKTVEKKIALTFDGLTDADTMKEILALLEKYDMKGTFFVPGIKSAEDENTVLSIRNAKQEIGSYSLSAKKHMELLPEEEIVKDLSLTNVILRKTTGEAPDILKCNVTEYTDSFLYAVNASGIDSVVQSNIFLNFQSFSSYNRAKEYVAILEKGSIVSIKLEGVLSEEEYETKQEEMNPAVDKQAGLGEKDSERKTEVKITQAVEWLLQAIHENNYSTEFIKDLEAYHDSDFDKDYGVFRAANDGKLSKVYKDVNTNQHLVAYSFRGIKDEKMLNAILDLLEEKRIKATFFVTGNEVIEYPKSIRKILDAGHSLGNGGLTGNRLTEMDFGNVYFEIWKCHKILNEKFGVSTKLFMPAYGKYNDTVREAVHALGYATTTYSKNPITDKGSTISQIMGYFGNGFKQGDIIYFRLDDYDDVDQVVLKTFDKIKKKGYAVVDIQTLVKKESTPAQKKLTAASSSLNNKSEKTDPIPRDYQQLRIENKGNKAKIVNKLYTTQPTVAYIFRGISDREVLDRVLAVLGELEAEASFFVTGKEILNYPENIQAIIDQGHQVYNGGYGFNVANPSSLDFDALCYEIEMGKQCLKNFLGDAYVEGVHSYYMPLYADINGDVLEAASALGYKEVVTYNKNTMSERYKNLSADEIVKDYFLNTTTLHRGDIVYFRLDYFTQPGTIEQLVKKIADDYIKPSTYGIASIDNLLNSGLVYESNPRAKGAGSDLIKATYGYTEEHLLSSIFNRYIGNRSISTGSELIGFTEEEISKIDKTGEIDTNGEKVIFLTFDDWGSDTAIVKLLNVLDKYDTKATFFVRVGNDFLSLQNDMDNPNLLRAIALKGHDIGNHTFAHMKVDITTEEEASLLRADIVAAHQEMARYIGDTGALQLFFRPPTLAVSKLGLKTVFDSGFQYIVNGDFSTHDYAATSAEELIDKLKNGIGNRSVKDGSIIVMHMSDTSKYTAEALDEVIPYYQAQGYRFARLSDYLKN